MNYYLLFGNLLLQHLMGATDIDGLSSLKYGMSANITERFHQ